MRIKSGAFLSAGGRRQAARQGTASFTGVRAHGLYLGVVYIGMEGVYVPPIWSPERSGLGVPLSAERGVSPLSNLGELHVGVTNAAEFIAYLCCPT